MSEKKLNEMGLHKDPSILEEKDVVKKKKKRKRLGRIRVRRLPLNMNSSVVFREGVMDAACIRRMEKEVTGEKVIKKVGSAALTDKCYIVVDRI